jgi:hypothetical protein
MLLPFPASTPHVVVSWQSNVQWSPQMTAHLVTL